METILSLVVAALLAFAVVQAGYCAWFMYKLSGRVAALEGKVDAIELILHMQQKLIQRHVHGEDYNTTFESEE